MRIAFSEYHRYTAPLRVGSHHLAAEVGARGHQVTWLPHARSLLHRLRGETPPPAELRHPDGVVEVILRSLAPYVDLPALRSAWWGERWLRLGVDNRSCLEAAGLDRVDLLWISDLTMLPLVDLLPAGKVVLRFFDHLTEFRWMPRTVFELVRRHLPRVDLSIASSRRVQQELAGEGIEAVYVPNGADVRNLAPLAGEEERRDRVVYVGALEEWFDLEAMELWARGLPAMELVVVGPNRHGFSSSADNLRFVGPRPYEELPAILGQARFGVIPFRRGRLTDGVHPLKLYEYLAAGCPVLSADLPEVKPRAEGVFVYRDAAEGLAILRRQLDRPVDRPALRRLAVANGWGARLDRVGELLGIDFAAVGPGEDAP